MNILICESMDGAAVDRLRSRHAVHYEPALVDDPAALLAAAATADALVVRNRTQVRGELLAALTRCRAVGRLGVGLDNIDVDGCTARGIQVIPATGANAASVAEYVITAALLLLRGAYASTDDVAAGRWPRAALSGGHEIAGTTLGLVGYGSIGQATARLAGALGMRVIAFDAAMDADHPVFDDGRVGFAGLDEIVRTADVVSLHVPLVDGTRGLFDAARLASMKPGAVLINTARGGIVDEPALAEALRAGRLSGAAIDVFADEPLPSSPHFLDCPRLLLTPHIAGVTDESSRRVGEVIADRLIEVLP